MAADLALVRRLSGADRGLAVVATTRADGSVHTSVVNAGVFDAARGPAVAFVARGDAKKLGHIRRAGRAARRAGLARAGATGGCLAMDCVRSSTSTGTTSHTMVDWPIAVRRG